MQERLKNIEFLRIIGCIAVIMLHLFNKELYKVFPTVDMFQTLKIMTSNGQKAVDLFFILSGFFFAYKLNTNLDIIDFLRRKIIRFYPSVLFIVGIVLIASTFGIFEFKLYDTILALCGLSGTALILDRSGTHIGVFWYISTLLWVSTLFYFLRKNYSKNWVNLTIAFLVYCSYALLIQAKHGKINSIEQTFYNLFNAGMLRGIGGIGVGYFIGEWWKTSKDKINNIFLNTYQKLIITSIEFCCLFFMINNLICRNLKYNNDMIYIVDFIAIIILFISKKGYISQFINNQLGNFCEIISKYTYSLYITHYCIISLLENTIIKKYYVIFNSYPIFTITILLFSILAVGYFTYNFIEKPCNAFLKAGKTLVRVGGGKFGVCNLIRREQNAFKK